MGLELVEFVYVIEEEFEIEIPPDVAEKITTPRKLIDYLMTIPKIKEKWSRDYVSLTIMMILEDEIGVSREKMNEDSRFIEDLKMG